METITQSPADHPLEKIMPPQALLSSPELGTAINEPRPGPWVSSERRSSESRMEDQISLIECREMRRFTAACRFELSGVAFNGSTVKARHIAEASPSRGDRLLSKLLPTLDPKASVEFAFSGGGTLDFGWSISGSIQGCVSKDEALSKAKALRQNLLLVMTGEPVFRFEDIVCNNQTRPLPDPIYRAWLEPERIRLEIAPTSAIGFSPLRANSTADSIHLSLARPSQLSRSFSSLAEAVIVSPTPVSINVRFNPVSLTATQQAQIADTLNWLRRNPVALERQLAGQQLEVSALRGIAAQLRRWLAAPQGVRMECRVDSLEPVTAAFLAMIGCDTFGSPVSVNLEPRPTSAPESCPATKPENIQLSLEKCLPTGAPIPSLFPTLSSLAQSRLRRHYNVTPPNLEKQGMLLGAISEGATQTVYFDQTARNRHLYVLGATGTGKSTLLSNMIFQDIWEGRGVCLIDPHGDLYDEIVESIPARRAKDVVLFSPGASDYVPGLNILECDGPNRAVQVNFVITELLKTFDRMYDLRVVGGPMFETYFRNALLLLLESDLPAVTIMELSLVFEDKEFRHFLISRCRHPTVVGFWKEIAEKVNGDCSLANIAPYITSKLNAFMYNPIIRPIVGQARSTVDFRRIMDRQGILLIKLPKGILGEFDAQLLGSFLLSRIFSSAMGRANVRESKRHSFHLYVDEFQNFVNDGVAFMLAEARKYGLHLTLANQNLSQLAASQGRQNLVDAVLGNVGSLIAFRVGPPDAEKLRLYTEPEFNPMDLQGLPNYHAIGRIMTSAGPTRPFVFFSLPKGFCHQHNQVPKAVCNMRNKKFGRRIAEVEAAIAIRRMWSSSIAEKMITQLDAIKEIKEDEVE